MNDVRPEALDPASLESRQLGPVTIFFGYQQGKYPYGNSFLVTGSNQTAIIDPSLGMVARKSQLPEVDLVIHSHTHEDHISGTHLFKDAPWFAHKDDALGLESLDGLMTMYGLPPATDSAFRVEVEENFYYPHGGSNAGAVISFSDSHEFDLGGVTIKVIHTPGHTRGHCCFKVSWGASPAEQLVYLGDIELTGFGPYYGDAWSSLSDFEDSMALIREIDVHYWLTFHHKGLIEGREQFLSMLDKFESMIDDREQRLLAYVEEPRSLEEIVEHRFVYRPGQTGTFVDSVERISMGMHLERLMARGIVAVQGGRYQVVSQVLREKPNE